MTTDELNEIATAAKEHAVHARADILNAQTRLEHIRLTGLAVEAEQLATRLQNMLDMYRSRPVD